MNNLLFGLENIQANLMITLVHGTWGRGVFPNIRISSKPRWFEPEGKFRKNLTTELEKAGYNCRFNVFEWSGANSIIHRDTAAKNLTKFLQKDPAPETSYHVLIAHSHGGNVVSRAMAICNCRIEQTGVIFLATPFLQLFRRKIGSFEKYILSFSLSLILLLPVFIVTAIPFIVADYFLSNRLIFDMFNTWWSNAALMCISFTLSQRFLFGSPGHKADLKNDALVLATSSENIKNNHGPMLILRAIDDEASLALTAGTIASILSFKLLALLVIACIIVSNMNGFIYEHVFGGVSEEWFYFSGNIAGAMFIFNIIILATTAVTRSVFGRELLLRKPGTQINAQTVPDFATECEIKTMLRHSGLGSTALRHGIYEHPETESLIVKWIDKTFKRSIVRCQSMASVALQPPTRSAAGNTPLP